METLKAIISLFADWRIYRDALIVMAILFIIIAPQAWWQLRKAKKEDK